MAPSLETLRAAYDRARAYVDLVDQGDWIENRQDLSDFWREHFAERRNYPTFDEILLLRRGYTYGVGETTTDPDAEAEAEWARATFHVVRASAPDYAPSEFEESSIGAPLSTMIEGYPRSGSAIINALTSRRVVEVCRESLADRKLRVLEIGAGYGHGPQQLLQRLDIASYTVCDLPQNLLLSSFLLQANHPELATAFVGPDGAGDVDSARLVFLSPPFLDSVDGPFDLVVNAYSLQEMNRVSVEEYYAYIASHLSPGGRFYSLNSHGKAGIERPEQYPIELFTPVSFAPLRRYAFQLWATEPYELVLTAGPGVEPEAKARFAALARLLQLGFQDELRPICRAWAEGRLEAADEDWLDQMASGLEGSPGDRATALERVSTPPPLRAVADLALGATHFVAREFEASLSPLAAAAEALSPSQARVRALAMLACASHATGGDGVAEAVDSASGLTPHLKQEIEAASRSIELCIAGLAPLLDLPVPPAASPSVARRALNRLAS